MEERSHNREQTRDSELTLCRHVRIAIFTDVFIQIDRFRDPAAPEVDRVPREFRVQSLFELTNSNRLS